jgi:hypothetical protein
MKALKYIIKKRPKLFATIISASIATLIAFGIRLLALYLYEIDVFTNLTTYPKLGLCIIFIYNIFKFGIRYYLDQLLSSGDMNYIEVTPINPQSNLDAPSLQDNPGPMGGPNYPFDIGPDGIYRVSDPTNIKARGFWDPRGNPYPTHQPYLGNLSRAMEVYSSLADRKTTA